jgi:hypothetical protein
MSGPYVMRPVDPPARGASRWPDELGLTARYGSSDFPPGTLVRRNPGDPSCPACMEAADGYCREHPEFYVVKAPAPPPDEAEAQVTPSGEGEAEEASAS